MASKRLPVGILIVLSSVLHAGICLAARPHVLIIVTDDQGYGDLAAHGHPLLRTPNLDQLRDQSVRLEDYHVDPICTPTRGALMTGRYCGRNGAWDVISGRQLLHAREVTMAEVFRDAGYATAMFGKWHLGDPHPYDPGDRGFEFTLRHRAGGVDEMGNPIGNDFFDDIYYRNGVAEQFEGYCTDVFVRETRKYLENHQAQNEQKPFFVYLATNAMHSPFGVADKYADRFRALGVVEEQARFYGMIENFDENLGRLLATLQEQGVAENTIVLFFGDNGSAAIKYDDSGYNASMRGAKGSVYDGGHRVACFVRWPAQFEAGLTVDRLTSHRDWLPTLIELCDLPAPEVEFDGRSIACLLRGEEAPWRDRMMVVERQGREQRPAIVAEKPKRALPYAVLTEQWRLVNGELFDIQADPSQTTDLAKAHPQVVQSLAAHYHEYYEDVFEKSYDEACFLVGSPDAPVIEFTARDWRPTTGAVVWENAQLGRDDLFINGYWPIEALTTGRYQIELARYPFDLERPIEANRATIQIGEEQLAAELSPEAAHVMFTVELAAGRAQLTTALRDAAQGKERGAYFVRITKADE